MQTEHQVLDARRAVQIGRTAQLSEQVGRLEQQIEGVRIQQTATGRPLEILGGEIVNISSMLSFQGGIRVASYTASKSGVLGIARLLANE